MAREESEWAVSCTTKLGMDTERDRPKAADLGSSGGSVLGATRIHLSDFQSDANMLAL